ncbi:hypothetical protein CVD19_06410 [Bacillus sp. T33-2]|nr:hypothetical protein CVD19_06410 [Bacillus sp. T33-2]
MAFFLPDIEESGRVARAVVSVKQWAYPPAVETETFVEHSQPVPIIEIKDHALIDAPAISQMPELPRGCEVTSLTMLLQHAGISVDKMILAEKVKKNPETYKAEGGEIYFGDPNKGFVGNMYTFSEPGLGVYHVPIKELADQYLPGRIADLTGSELQEIKNHLSEGRPVWVITNIQFKKLPETAFQTWQTPDGEIKVTYKEHSVLLTGYDGQSIYFNDPLTGEKNKKAPIADFEESWVQMGRQAITYLPH